MEEEKEINEDEYSVFVGYKDTIIYVFAVTTQAETFNRVLIKARGKAISKAVDISQIALNKYLKEKGWKLGNVFIGTEVRPYRKFEDNKYETPNKENQDVSVIEIEVLKE